MVTFEREIVLCDEEDPETPSAALRIEIDFACIFAGEPMEGPSFLSAGGHPGSPPEWEQTEIRLSGDFKPIILSDGQAEKIIPGWADIQTNAYEWAHEQEVPD